VTTPAGCAAFELAVVDALTLCTSFIKSLLAADAPSISFRTDASSVAPKNGLSLVLTNTKSTGITVDLSNEPNKNATSATSTSVEIPNLVSNNNDPIALALSLAA